MFSTTGVTQQQQQAVAHIAAMPQHRGHTIEVEADGGWLLITMVAANGGVVEYLVSPNGDWDQTVRVEVRA